MLMVRSEIPQKTLEMKKQEMSSLVGSKENKNNQSFRIYYGDFSSAVPFIWESQPGTPKHVFHTSTLLPPLTPPPSYATTKNTALKRHPKSTHLLHTLFPRLMKQSSSPALSLSTSWSSLSTTSSSVCGRSSNDHHTIKRFKSRFMGSGSTSFDSFEDDLYHVSTPCFGFGNRENGGALRSSAKAMKKAFLAIVGQGSKLRY